MHGNPPTEVLAIVDGGGNDVDVLQHDLTHSFGRSRIEGARSLQFASERSNAKNGGSGCSLLKVDGIIAQGLILSSVCGSPMIAEAGGGYTASGGGLGR
ncbi:hypothetical protein ASF14_11110 [Sphingomonas sp. Leaf257]|nr:hypothetical protein ASF14_11110 [Sphingomonas sp. Leaf257]